MTKRTPTLAARADVPPDRRETKTFPVHLDVELWRRFRRAAFEREISMHALIIEALEEKLARSAVRLPPDVVSPS